MVRAQAAPLLGSLVRAKRQQLRLTQAELAEQAGVSRSEISEIEAGRIQQPRAQAFARLCKVLGISGAAVLGVDISMSEGLAEIDQEELYFLATQLIQLARRDPEWLRERLTELRDLLVVRARGMASAMTRRPARGRSRRG